MKTCNIWFAALAVTLFSAISYGQTPGAAPIFQHRPFPEIPRGAIVKNEFAVLLPAACKVLADDAVLPILLGEAPTTGAPTTGVPVANPTLDASLVQQVTRTLATLGDTTDVTDDAARTERVKTAWSEVKDVCSRIRSADLTEANIARLRDLAAHGIPALFFFQQLNTADEHPDDGKVEVTKKAVVDALADSGTESSGVGLFGMSGAALSDTLIQGLAEFLAKRAKQEALLYLQNQLAKNLCVVPRGEFFPATCSAIKSVDPGQSLESIASLLKAAATKDLKDLPDVSLAFLAHKQPDAAEPAFAGRVGYRIAREMAAGRTLADVFAQLGAIDWTKAGTGPATKGIEKALQATSAVTYALQQVEPEKGTWHKRYKFGDEWATASLAGVLVLAETRAKAVPAAQGFLTADVANGVLKKGDIFLQSILQAQEDFSSLQTALSDKTLEGAAKRERIADVIRLASTAVASQLRAYASLSQGSDADRLLESADALQISGEVTASALYGDFGASVVSLLALLDEVGGEKASSDPDLKAVRSFLGFILEVGTAQDSQGVSAALESYAAPLGTFKVKYRRALFAVGAVVGAHVGSELINTTEDTEQISGASGFVAGFAPVGVTASWPLGKKGADNLFHLGAMVSILDVGALTTYRFESELEGGTDPEASQAPEVSFAQVFSPGAYVTLGLFGSPFVLGGGVSFTPELRTITDGTAEFKAPAVRVGAFVAVDVPIFPMN